MSVSSSTVVTTIFYAAAVASLDVYGDGVLAGRSLGVLVLHSL